MNVTRSAVYFDGTALAIRAVPCDGTAALRTWTETMRAGHRLMTSPTAVQEVIEQLQKMHARRKEIRGLVGQALIDLHCVTEDCDLAMATADLDIAVLGRSGAIHLATALHYAADIAYFVTYDPELAKAARAHDLPVVSPD